MGALFFIPEGSAPPLGFTLCDPILDLRVCAQW
jgi:hypothetical protein